MVRKKMKDLSAYFGNSIISCDDSDVELDEVKHQVKYSEVRNNFKRSNTRKRARVKKAIPQSNSRNRMCDIEDCENEFSGRTPSSFDIAVDKTDILSVSDILECSIGSSCGENGNERIDNVQMELDSTNESIFSVDITRKKIKLSPINNGVSIHEREESNAFQVLMTRTKAPKPLPPKQLTPEERILTAKNRQESRSEPKQDENKLIITVERKGNAKRKLIDKEDEQEDHDGKTEKRLGNRTKIFKKTTSKDFIESSPPDSNRKVLVNGLHNYFNKITPEEREKERLLAVSTLVVKADVHESKSIVCAKPLAPKSNNNNNIKSKKRQVFTTSDDIQILRSESPPLIEAIRVEQTALQQSQSQHKKPKWSLRINFQSQEPDSDIIDEDILVKRRTRLNNWVASKQKGVKKEVHSNKETQKDEKIEQYDDIALFDGVNIECNTDKSSIISNNEINDVLETDLELCDRGVADNASNKSFEIVEVKKSSNDKLAPLFTKRLKPDPKVVAARHSFLHSRSPEDEKKKSQHKAQVPTISMLPFPLISHVTQLDVETGSNNSCHDIESRLNKQSVYVPTLDSSNLKHVNSSNAPQKERVTAKQVGKVNIENVLQQIEKQCTDAQEIWKTISSVTNKGNQRLTPKKRGPKRKSIDKKTNQVDNRNSIHIDTWTQKYRPLSAKDVVGNEEAALKLQNWLRTWKLSSTKDDYSSGEEFRCSDNSSNDSFQNNQVAVLLGPHGSGKTASVYAIAEELGYTVLEVNASSRRSGRKILKELEEATKSHRVKNTDSKALSQRTLSNNKNTTENSLILVEDVDLIFDEDDGFISAIYQLSSNTKRPIVMTCRESCLHLSRMAPQQLRIYFQMISGSRAMALIELIALAETGSSIPHPCLEKLLVSGDLRKALLRLQYLLLSGSPNATELSSSFYETLWQDTRSYLYKPNVKVTKKRIKEKNKGDNSHERGALGLGNLADDLDTISLVSSLVDINDPVLNVSRVKFEPTVSLEENVDLYCNNSVRSLEISEWLRCKVMHKYIGERDEIDMNTFNELVTRKNSNMGVNRALSQVSNHTLDTRLLSTDYLPTVRTICRAEDVKVRNNMKRGNRFFHYLQNLRIPSTSIKPNILTAACKIMQEAPDIVSKP